MKIHGFIDFKIISHYTQHQNKLGVQWVFMPRLASRDPATRWPWRVLINAAPEKPVWSCSQRQKGAVRSGSKVSTKFRGTQYLDNKRWKEKVLLVNAFNKAKAKAHSPNIVKIIRWHLYERSRERDRWTMGAKQDSSCLMFSSLRLQTSHLARRHTCQLYKFYLQRTSRSPTYHNTTQVRGLTFWSHSDVLECNNFNIHVERKCLQIY